MRRILFSTNTRKPSYFNEYLGAKKWVVEAIKGEGKKPNKSLWLNAPTADQADDLRISAIRRFRRKKRNLAVDSVISRLTNCSGEDRCSSAACPECSRLFQRAFVRATRRYTLKSRADENAELVVITIIPTGSQIFPGKLRKFNIQNFVRRIKGKLKRSNIDAGIGAVDFSFNEHKGGFYEPHWCPHVHMIGWTSDIDQLRADLKSHFHGDGMAIQRPTHIRQCDGTRYGISYRYKIEFVRRVTQSSASCRNPDYLRLSSDQKVEIALYLDKVGLGSRLILLGLKAYVSRGRLKLERAGP